LANILFEYCLLFIVFGGSSFRDVGGIATHLVPENFLVDIDKKKDASSNTQRQASRSRTIPNQPTSF